MLPPMAAKDPLKQSKVDANQHFTQPPPRYSEASLVKKMEELGIGRPSTYASILSVLQDRKYVRLEKRRFIPEDRGRLVTAFLVSFFEHYVDTGFTAALEEKLDEVSAGQPELARGDARVLGRVLQGGGPDQGPEDQRRHQRAGSGSGPAFLPGAGGRQRSAAVHRLWQWPAWPEARAVGQFHRLLELSGVPLYPQPRGRYRRRGRRYSQGRPAHPGSGSRDGRGHHGPARPLRPVCPAGRADRGQEGPPQTHHSAARDGRRSTDAGAGGRAAVDASHGRDPSRRRRSRSRSVSGGSGHMCGWDRCSARWIATTTCWRWG